MTTKTNWYVDFFNDITLDFWRKTITPQYTKNEVNFILKMINAKPNDKILDAPCGFGRHSIALARKGFCLTAIDLAKEYIQKLQQTAKKNNLPIDCKQGDINEMAFGENYKAVICFGNSFSYFDYNGMTNFISKVSNSLSDKGIFIANTSMLAENIPNMQEREWMTLKDITLMVENRYEFYPSRYETDFIFIKDEKKTKRTAIHYIYTHAEIERMFKQAGMHIIETCASTSGEPFHYRDPQAYIVAGKM